MNEIFLNLEMMLANAAPYVHLTSTSSSSTCATIFNPLTTGTPSR